MAIAEVLITVPFVTDERITMQILHATAFGRIARSKGKTETTVAKAVFPVLVALLVTLVTSGGCGNIRDINDAMDGDYHSLSPAPGGAYLTIKGHATNGMTAFFNNCKNRGDSDSSCGAATLRRARDAITPKIHGSALGLWNGEYTVYGYHPNIGNGFRDEEGSEFATAVRDLAGRGHECLRVHWKATGTNWTTVDDEGVAECEAGRALE
jgi:hypothetical protein